MLCFIGLPATNPPSSRSTGPSYGVFGLLSVWSVFYVVVVEPWNGSMRAFGQFVLKWGSGVYGLACGLPEVVPHGGGSVKQTEVLQYDGDVDGGIGTGEVAFELVLEID